jgi:hypothetical protein
MMSFGALALYASTDSARDLAPIAGLVGGEIRFGPEISRAYLGQLDRRIKAVRDALVDGFGVEPGRVLQNAYEPIQYDETGSYCGAQPTLGMDVHPSLKVNKARLSEVAECSTELQKRLECMASTAGRRDCPAGLRPGRTASASSPITSRILQARHLRAQSRARDRSGRDEDAAALKVSDFEPYSATTVALRIAGG